MIRKVKSMQSQQDIYKMMQSIKKKKNHLEIQQFRYNH